MNSFKDASSILFDLKGVFNEGHIVACAVSENVIAGSYFSMGLGCNRVASMLQGGYGWAKSRLHLGYG